MQLGKWTIPLFLFFLFYVSKGIEAAKAEINDIQSCKQKICIDVNKVDIDKLEALDDVKPFILGELSYSSNVNFDEKEFEYLVDLKPGDLIDSTILKNCCFYLKQKHNY